MRSASRAYLMMPAKKSTNSRIRISTIVSSKNCLLRRDFGAARRAFVDACRCRQAWKVRAAMIGVHIAPDFIRRIYQARNDATAPTCAR